MSSTTTFSFQEQCRRKGHRQTVLDLDDEHKHTDEAVISLVNLPNVIFGMSPPQKCLTQETRRDFLIQMKVYFMIYKLEY